MLDNHLIQQMKKQTMKSLERNLHYEGMSMLTKADIKFEIKIFFDKVFGSLGLKLNASVDAVENTDLTDYIYAKVKQLLLWLLNV